MIVTDRFLSLFGKLIFFDSPSFDERRIGGFATQQLHKLGRSVFEDGAAEVLTRSNGS